MSDYFKIVQTDNYNDDYPDENFVTGIGALIEVQAKAIAEEINKQCCTNRYWKVVKSDYVLRPGFEP